jgi:Tfp pilus assembly protein PilV
MTRKSHRIFARSSLSSFSLVEIVIAIAVVSFVLVSLLGLMGYLIKTLQKIDQYTRLANVSSQVLAQISSQPFSYTTNFVHTNGICYFTYEGLSNNGASGAYYQCAFTNTTPTNAYSNITPLSNYYSQIEVIISWPLPKPVSTNVISTSCLNYD